MLPEPPATAATKAEQGIAEEPRPHTILPATPQRTRENLCAEADADDRSGDRMVVETGMPKLGCHKQRSRLAGFGAKTAYWLELGILWPLFDDPPAAKQRAEGDRRVTRNGPPKWHLSLGTGHFPPLISSIHIRPRSS